MADLGRFDSTQLFNIFRADADNLLDFDGLAGMLDFDPDVADELLQLPEEAGVSPIADAAAQQLLADVKSEQEENSHNPGGPDNNWAFHRSSTAAGSSDVQGDSSAEPAQPYHQQQQQQAAAAGPAPRRSNGGGRGRGSASTASEGADGGAKKRRTRNDDQMEMNRIAQQKYRERKRAEQEGLQGAVDMLTAQVAALKMIEVRAQELEAHNAQLSATVSSQAGTIASLQERAAGSEAQLTRTQSELAAARAVVAKQQHVIMDQHQKLQLQEQIIASLKDRLKDRIDEAMSHVAEGTVCQKVVAAVKATLYEAKDQHGLQEVLAQLPEHLVTELCKNIFCVCKESWPEIKSQCAKYAGVPPGSACPYA